MLFMAASSEFVSVREVIPTFYYHPVPVRVPGYWGVVGRTMEDLIINYWQDKINPLVTMIFA